MTKAKLLWLLLAVAIGGGSALGYVFIVQRPATPAAAVASPACAELAKLADPSSRPDLQDECPRAVGARRSGFVPSEKKEW